MPQFLFPDSYDPDELDALGKGRGKKPPKEEELPGPPGGGDGKPPTEQFAPEDTSRVAYGYYGLGRSGGTAFVDPLLSAQAISREEGERWVVLDNFRYGIMSRFKRGTAPLGSLADSQNFIPNKKIGALVQRPGYSSHISVPFSAGGFTFTSILHYWRLGTENPSAQNIDLVVASDGTNTFWLQKPYFLNGAVVNDWRIVRERLAAANVTAKGTNTLTISNGSSTDDFYKGWIIVNHGASDQALYITAYNGTTKVLTTNEDVPSGWGLNNNYTIFNAFHDNFGFVPIDSTWPVAVQQGDAILASGGQSSNTGAKLWWSGYIKATYFPGLSRAPQIDGTYFSEAEVKSTAGISQTYFTSYSVSPNSDGLEEGRRWFACFVLETHDGQLSNPIKASTNYIDTNTLGAGYGIKYDVRIDFPRLNKRVVKVHHFMGFSENTGATSLQWGQYFYISTDTLNATGHGYTYNTSTSEPGYYTKTISLNNNSWLQRGESLQEFLGRSESDSTTVSCNYMEFVNDRLFVAGYYDYVSGKSYNDSIRFSGFSGSGVPQYNVLAAVPGESEIVIEAGDPTSIQHIGRWEDKLTIKKDQNLYAIPITANPETWQLIIVARNIGCDVPRGVVTTPFGEIIPKAGDDIYLYRGGYPESLLKDSWIDTWRALTTTYKANWWGWYNPTRKSYNIMYTTDGSDKKTWWEMFFEFPVGRRFAWFRHKNTLDIQSVRVDRDGNVLFASGNIYKFDNSTSDNGTAIQTYFKTNPIVLSERDLLEINGWYLAIDQDTNATRANNLDCKLLVDGSVYTFDGISTQYTNMTKTNLRFESLTPIGTQGRRVEFEWNSNATPATWVASSQTATPLTILEFGVRVATIELDGDMAQSL